MYDNREPTTCWKCVVAERGPERIDRVEAAITRAIQTGNRKARRAAKKLGKCGAALNPPAS